jgi:integral membrane protein
MSAALIRYRVMAYGVGILLLLLALIAMPMKYLRDSPGLVETIGPIHGFGYAVYLLVSFDLARRCGWRLGRTVVVLLAGTLPFVSFLVERSVTRQVRSTLVD